MICRVFSMTAKTTRRSSTSDAEASTRFSNISDSEAISRLCHYFRREHSLHTQTDQTWHQMTTDLLGIKTVVDCHQGQSDQRHLQSSYSNETSPNLKPQALRWKPEDLSLATGEISRSGLLPIERWLAEDHKHAPFNTIEA